MAVTRGMELPCVMEGERREALMASNRPQPYRVSEQKILWADATTGYGIT